MDSRVGRVGLLLVLLCAVTTRCGHGRSPLAEATPTPQAEWSLTVTNHHWLDLTVYVIYDGQRARVGAVPSARTETYLLPPYMLGPGRTLRLEASAIGSSSRATTEALIVRGGQHVEWTLESGLERSTVAVR